MNRLVLLFFLSNCCIAFAQLQNSNWHFGNYATMSFPNNGAPILGPTTSQLSTDEGSASISDINGTLLFYTDGGTVWNANDAIMSNGTDIQGYPYQGSSAQSCIIIKKPGSANLYYIFCVAESGSPSTPFSYSIVDMSLNGGLGAVTSKANVLFNGTSEKIAATYHCNGTDIWIATHDLNTNNYRTVLLSSTGVGAPVITSIGPIITGNNLGISTEGIGSMKFTSDGLRLALSNISTPDVLDLLSFNKSTGVFSNRLDIYSPLDFDGLYGLEFSPNNQVLYVSNFISSELLQYDISLGSAANIAASRTSVGLPFERAINQLQLAPDGKIYAAQRRSPLPVGVINSPNVLGMACNWDSAGFDPSSSGMDLTFGLPSQLNIIPTNFNYQFAEGSISLCKTTINNSQVPNFYSSYPVNNGVFTSTPEGLSINTTTGAINTVLSASGTYNVTFTAPLPGCISPHFSTYVVNIVNCADPCLVQNHSFEYILTEDFYTNWSPGGDTTEINPETTYGGSTVSNKVAEIDAAAWLQQTVSGFVIGDTYNLTFLAGRRIHIQTPASVTIAVAIDGGALTSPCTRTNATWGLTTQTYNFVATQTTHVLSLRPQVTYAETFGMIIDDIDICPSLNLPIELLSFNGESVNDKNHLTWTTVSEINNNYYALERSANGFDFEAIGTIAGGGTTNAKLNYSFTDNNPNSLTYYRLKQTDYNGEFKYSYIISLVQNNESEFEIFPNPSSGLFTIRSDEEITNIKIFDSLGRILSENTNKSIDLCKFEHGLYSVVIFSDNKIRVKKIIKM